MLNTNYTMVIWSHYILINSLNKFNKFAYSKIPFTIDAVDPRMESLIIQLTGSV